MNDSLLRRFCESPQRKLIVVIGTVVFGLVVLIPLVDDYFDKKNSHSTLTEELASARQTADKLPKLEQEVAQIASQLQAIEAHAVTESSVSEYRSQLVDMVRETGCQMRRLDVGTPSLRPWLQKDDPLADKATPTARNQATPFTLERRSMSLLVDGPVENIRDLLKQLHEDEVFAYLHHLELHSDSRSGDRVTLEVQMWLFALGRHKA